MLKCHIVWVAFKQGEESHIMRLDPDELRFFKENGYLIKRGVLDPQLMARARRDARHRSRGSSYSNALAPVWLTFFN